MDVAQGRLKCPRNWGPQGEGETGNKNAIHICMRVSVAEDRKAFNASPLENHLSPDLEQERGGPKERCPASTVKLGRQLKLESGRWQGEYGGFRRSDSMIWNK